MKIPRPTAISRGRRSVAPAAPAAASTRTRARLSFPRGGITARREKTMNPDFRQSDADEDAAAAKYCPPGDWGAVVAQCVEFMDHDAD